MATEVRCYPLGAIGALLENEKVYLWKYLDGPLMASPADQMQFPFEGITLVGLEKRKNMSPGKHEEEMEKRGVSCSCAEHPDKNPDEMVKTASGMACPHCGKGCKGNKKDLTGQQ